MQPAAMLVGCDLSGNWKVIERVKRSRTATGANFSVGYIVQNSDGRRGFLKAMDYWEAFNHPQTAEMLQWITNAYLFEKNVCQRCQDNHLRRIVHAVASGTIIVDPQSPYSKVEYLIFELADGDIRAHLDAQQDFDLAFALRALHHVATGLEQRWHIRI
jgi:hypothetical protein